MRGVYLLTSIFISCIFTACAQAADNYMALSELLESSTVKEYQAQGVKLYWGNEAAPEFAEVAKPDSYMRTSISLSPFGGSKRHCVDAFERAVKAIVDDAKYRGYDAVLNLRPVFAGKVSDDPKGFDCKPGYKTTEVGLNGSFAMSADALQRAKDAEQRAMNVAPRSPAKDTIFIALEPIFNSPEAKAILGVGISVYAGATEPAYTQRYGPDEYGEYADIKALSKEEACKQAVLNTLKTMVEDAKTRGFDAIIRIRSVLNEQRTPVVTDAECMVGRKGANVLFNASLANKK